MKIHDKRSSLGRNDENQKKAFVLPEYGLFEPSLQHADDIAALRQQLLDDRQRLRSSARKLQEIRHQALEKEVHLMDMVRKHYPEPKFELEGPKGLATLYAEVSDTRDKLSTAEDVHNRLEKENNDLEWALVQKEEDSYQHLLGNSSYRERSCESDLFRGNVLGNGYFADISHGPKTSAGHSVRKVALGHATENYVIPSELGNGKYGDAIGDYCAKKNFMTKSYADQLGLVIDEEAVLSVLTGSGKMTKTIGSATAQFRFKQDPEVYALRFEILSTCVHDIILSKAFLKATKTFSSAANRARRVIKRIANKLTPQHMFFLGDSAPRFQGSLNGLPQTALADSGCKVLLMDEDYAEQLGLPILRGNEHSVKLVFADNSTAMSSGMVKGVRWSFGTSAQEQEYSLDFHVLKNAPAPVILSDKLLFDTDAYSQYECYLEDEDDEDEEAYFLAIDIDHSYWHEGNSNTEAGEQHAELVRRGEEDDRIAALPASERDQAHLVEARRRAEWVMHMQQPSSHMQPPGTASSSPQNGNILALLKSLKTQWWLKLKQKKRS